jgi:CheY-like chemotaxis protein
VTISADRKQIGGFPVHSVLPKPIEATSLLAALSSAGVQPNRSQTVLVVEDDPHLLKLMEAALTDLGYLPVCNRTAEEALASVQRRKPDVVILDIMLPGMGGIEFLTIFRDNPKHHRIPVILWTNKDLDATEVARLKHLDSRIVLKRIGGIRHLLEEIGEQLATSTVKSSETTGESLG